MFAPILVTPPDADIITLAEAKSHCRVDHTDDDDLISGLIAKATSHLDGASGILGRCLISQTWRVDFPCWNSCFRLPFPNVRSATVSYFDTSNVEQTVADASVEVFEDHISSIVRMSNSFARPSTYSDRAAPVRIEFIAGYGDDAADVPQAITLAALLLIGHLYENREASTAEAMSVLPLAFDALVAPFRRVGI